MKKNMAKVLASALSLAMAVTLVTPSNASAAAAPKFSKTYGNVNTGKNYLYTVKNVKKGYKVKVSVTGSGKSAVTLKKSNKKVTTIKVTGKTASFKAAIKASASTVNKKPVVTAVVYNEKGKKVKTLKDTVAIKAPTTSISLTAPKETVTVDEAVQFKATVKPSYSTSAITYTVDNTDGATIDSKTGEFKASQAGTYVVTATSNKKTATATISVEEGTMSMTGKQTGTKTIEVTGTKAFASPSAITVKKGSVTVALAEKDGVQVGSDGKTLVITAASKLSAGDYTITASKADDDATCTVTGEDEKVEKVEFLSDKAVLNKKVVDKYTTAYVCYKVYNQFGEDVTKDTNSSVEVNGSEASKTEAGKVTFTRAAGYNLNDVVAAVVIYKNGTNVVSQTGTFTVSSEAVVNEITIKEGVYNKDGKKLTEDSDLAKDAYYILTTAKDQYGNNVDMKATDPADASEDNVLLQFVGGITQLKATSIEADKITVDGVDYQAIRLSKDTGTLSAGSATALIVSKGTGKTAQTTVEVVNGSKVDKITLQVPDLIVGNEETEIGYTALDSYGNEVTSKDALAACDGIAASVGAVPNGKGLYVKEDAVSGKAKLYYKAASNTRTMNDIDVVTIMTKTYQATTVQFTIRPNAVATAIVGTKDLTTGVLSGKNFTIKKNNIVVQDQYGRSDKVADNRYTIAVTPVDARKAAGVFANVADVSLASITTDITATATSAAVTTSAKLKFTLNATQNDATVKSDVSSYEVTFTVAPQNDVKSYEVADIGSVYNSSYNTASYEKTIDVKGVLGDGTKISIPATECVFVSGDANLTVNTSGVVKAASDLTAAGKPLEKEQTVKYTVIVTINKTGDEFKKEVVVSKEAPKAVTVEFADGDHFKIASGTATQAKLLNLLKIKDQYGVEYKGDTTITAATAFAQSRVTFANVANEDDASPAAITNNGSSTAQIADMTKLKSADLTITFPDGTTFKGKLAQN